MTDAAGAISEDPTSRVLQVSTLTDRFEIVEPETCLIADLKARLQAERLHAPVNLFLEDGRKLLDEETVGSLTAGAKLVCVAARLDLLESQIAELGTPGDEFQKYLRTYVGVSAGDQRIMNSLWAVSILASTADGWSGTEPCDQVAGAVIKLLECIWSRARRVTARDTAATIELKRGVPMNKELTIFLQSLDADELQQYLRPLYSCQAHEKLLTWILEDPDRDGGKVCQKGEPSPRMRVMLAEIDQILVRGADCLLEGSANSRQSEAFGELLKVARCSSDTLIHWNAFAK
jgi:hypothetical protein